MKSRQVKKCKKKTKN